jgi:hypothetical protein
MKDLGALKHILSMRIIRDKRNSYLKLSQKKYVKRELHKLNIDNVKPINNFWLVISD